MKKRLISLFLAFVMCLAPFSVALAGGADANKPTLNPGAANLGGMEGVVNSILGVIKGIGYVVAVIMVMYVGIKYLTAGAGKKAEVKDTLIPILIGAILLLGAITLVDWIWGAVGGAAK